MSLRVLRRIALGMCAASTSIAFSQAAAAPACVSNSSELKNATIVANNSGSSSTEIRIRSGTYLPPASHPFVGAFSIAPENTFRVSGGWTDPSCTSQIADATQTVIDGDQLMRVMGIFANVDVTLANLTLRNGYANSAGCLTISGSKSVYLENVILDGCYATGRGGALSAADLSYFTVRGLLVIHSQASNGAALDIDVPPGGRVSISQSTFADNALTSGPDTAVVYAGGGGNVSFFNDLFTRNTLPSQSSYDIVINTAPGQIAFLRNSAYSRGLWTDDTIRSANVETDAPLLLGFWDYRTRPGSAARNGGINDGSFIPLERDIFGRPRILEGSMDIGATESDVLFEDGCDGALPFGS